MGDALQRYGGGDVQPPLAEALLFGAAGFNGEVVDPVQLDIGGVPVQRVALHGDAVVQPPVLQAEGAVADEVARPGPGAVAVGHLAVRQHSVPVHRIGGVVRQQGREVGRGPLQPHLQGLGVQRAHPHLREVVQPPPVKGLGVLHRVQHLGVLRAQRRRQDALPRPHIVVRRDRVAVPPARVFAQPEGVQGAVAAHLVGLGHAVDRLAALGVVAQQPLAQRLHQAVFRHARDDVRVQPLDLGADAPQQHLAFGLLAAGAAGRQQGGGRQRQGRPPKPAFGGAAKAAGQGAAVCAGGAGAAVCAAGQGAAVCAGGSGAPGLGMAHGVAPSSVRSRPA